MRITVMSPDRPHLQQIERALQRSAQDSRLTFIEASLQRWDGLTEDLGADVLVVDCATDNAAELAPLERIGTMHPDMAILLLCRRQAPEFLIRAMQLGVREVLNAPVDPFSLNAAIERIRTKSAQASSANGKVLAFISCKGGSGATFLSANLAYALATQGECKVALFDLNLQFGDALLFLSEHKASHTLSDVVQGIHRLDAALLKTSMVNVAPNLDVLAAPEDPSQAMEVKPEHIDALLQLARRHYDYVILDVGHSLDAPTVRALDKADKIYAVLQSSLPFVRGARRMVDIFQKLEYPESKAELILNRYEKGGDVDARAAESALGKRISRTLPNHYDAATASVNQGIPVLRLSASGVLSKALREWSAQLLRKPAPEPAHWILRFLKRA
ncbi:response regulator receiver protein [Herbaspirillum sp. HC18]|nr:response regulator receiver protein [Herbaspirillum sp. HC18]